MGGGVGLILANYSGKLFPKSSQETNLFLGRATPDKLLKLWNYKAPTWLAFQMAFDCLRHSWGRGDGSN